MMILEYGAKNYFSFKEGFEISFRLNKNCPDHISKGKDFSNVLCIKGGNASGKTNVLKALNFINEFCADSFNLKPDENILLEPYFFNDQPSFFYIIFRIDEYEYKYELEATDKKVISEIISRKANSYRKVIERHGDKIKTIAEYKELESMNLRSNASIISTANQYDYRSIKEIYSFFNDIRTNVSNFGFHQIKPELNNISEYYIKYPDVFEFVKKQIKECDLGISDIEILTREDQNGEKIYYPVYLHELDDGRVAKLLHIYESSGTRALYNFLYIYNFTLSWGGVLALDEFDINLHPHILPKLIKLFEETNNDAQLIFTTHNEKIMDYLGKYRTVIVNKRENCSFLYRLDDVPGDILRNDRQISKVYDSGKIGGLNRVD